VDDPIKGDVTDEAMSVDTFSVANETLAAPKKIIADTPTIYLMIFDVMLLL
jgi:hypothetical protein